MFWCVQSPEWAQIICNPAKICPHSVKIWYVVMNYEGYIRVEGIIHLEGLVVRNLFHFQLAENKSLCTERIMFIFKGKNKHNAGVTK